MAIGSDPTTLQVVAAADNGRVAIGINGRWRWADATVGPTAGPAGATARPLDVWVVASDNVFTAGSPGEIDSTDYDFDLAITESGVSPVGAVLSRKVGTAWWDGAKFVAVMNLTYPPGLGPQLWVPLASLVNCSPLAGAYAPAARIVGDTVQLRGNLTGVSAPNPGFTLPLATMYPAATVYLGLNLFSISTSGVALITGGSGTCPLDGLSFPRT